jgi:hypothetical protein
MICDVSPRIASLDAAIEASKVADRNFEFALQELRRVNSRAFDDQIESARHSGRYDLVFNLYQQRKRVRQDYVRALDESITAYRRCFR